MTKSKSRDVFEIVVFFKFFRDLRSSDIAGILDDLGKRNPAVFVGIMDGSAGVSVVSEFTIEKVLCSDNAFIQRRRGENGFESRARFVAVGDRAVAPSLRR